MYRWKRLRLLFLVTFLALALLSISAARLPNSSGNASPASIPLVQDSGEASLLSVTHSGPAPTSATTEESEGPLLSTWAAAGLFLIMGSGAFLMGSRFVPRA